MKIKIISILTVLLTLGCVSIPDSTFAFHPDTIKSSYADNRLLGDLIGAPGGVIFTNKTLYPQVTSSVLTKIEVVTPYDNINTGVEKWYIEHNTGEIVCYIVNLIPDGKGGTYFTTSKE